MAVIQFDEKKWPDLTRFREACLADNYAEMQVIADRQHHWYPNENPDDLAPEKLAKIFQAQHFAAENAMKRLRAVIDADPWVINHPWTAQGWLPITQAACSHGNRTLIEYLVEKGADPTLIVGDPSDQATVPQMARSGGHEELAQWLEAIIDQK